MEEKKKKKVIELKPISKWKRILVFLGDYFIAFILSFILFNLAVFPIGKLIMRTQEKNEETIVLEEKANELLTNNGILFKEKGPSQSFEQRVNFTFKVFLSYYLYDAEEVDANHPQFGHKEEHEVIRNYYLNYFHDEAAYLRDFKEVDTKNMFIIGETANDVALKEEYRELLGPELLEVTDEEKYSTNMTNVRDLVFAKLFYLHVYNDITKNDFVASGGLSGSMAYGCSMHLRCGSRVLRAV